MNAIRKQVETLSTLIAGCKTEIERLRQACPHASYSVRRYDFGTPFRVHVSRVCDDCLAPIGTPSREELSAYEEGEWKRMKEGAIESIDALREGGF